MSGRMPVRSIDRVSWNKGQSLITLNELKTEIARIRKRPFPGLQTPEIEATWRLYTAVNEVDKFIDNITTCIK